RRLDLVDLPSHAEAERLLDEALAVADLPELPEAEQGAALRRWREFRDDDLARYASARDRPDVDGTSRLSPYLKVGAVHPRTLLADLAGRRDDGARAYETELAWREFYADVLHHVPCSAWHD